MIVHPVLPETLKPHNSSFLGSAQPPKKRCATGLWRAAVSRH